MNTTDMIKLAKEHQDSLAQFAATAKEKADLYQQAADIAKKSAEYQLPPRTDVLKLRVKDIARAIKNRTSNKMPVPDEWSDELLLILGELLK